MWIGTAWKITLIKMDNVLRPINGAPLLLNITYGNFKIVLQTQIESILFTAFMKTNPKLSEVERKSTNSTQCRCAEKSHKVFFFLILQVPDEKGLKKYLPYLTGNYKSQIKSFQTLLM